MLNEQLTMLEVFRGLIVHSCIIQNLAGKPLLTLSKPTANLPDSPLRVQNKSKETMRGEEESFKEAGNRVIWSGKEA